MPHSVVVIALAMALSGISARASGTPPLLEEFRSTVRQWIADADIVIAEYESQGSGANYTTIGLDPRTGAWFSASGSHYSGKTANGVSYISDARTNEPIISNETEEKIAASLSSLIPMALPITLLHTDRGLLSLERDNEHNWVIHYEGLGPDPADLPVATLVLTAGGVPVRSSREAVVGASGSEAISRLFEFEELSSSPLLIARRPPLKSGPHPLVLTKVTQLDGHRPDLFEIETVRALSADNAAKVQMRLYEIAAKRNEGDRAPAQHEAPYAASRLNRASWPLIVTGIVVVLIGLFVLIRGRVAR